MSFEILETEYLKVKDDSLAFIRFYECNSDAIEKLDDSDDEQKGFKQRMNGDYGLCLANSGTTDKAVKVLETFIPIFEKESGLTETELMATPYYEHLLWAFGSSLYYTDQVDETEKIFERLVKMQPDNQKYKNWLRGTKEKRFSKFRKGLYVSIFVWFAIDILFMKSMDSRLKGIFLLSGAILLGATVILETYVYLLKRSVR
jgi:tetratricopeptide (TPR) repeat protein